MDLGAARFYENYNRAVGLASDPPFEMKEEPQLDLDEEMIAYHVDHHTHLSTILCFTYGI